MPIISAAPISLSMPIATSTLVDGSAPMAPCASGEPNNGGAGGSVVGGRAVAKAKREYAPSLSSQSGSESEAPLLLELLLSESEVGKTSGGLADEEMGSRER